MVISMSHLNLRFNPRTEPTAFVQGDSVYVTEALVELLNQEELESILCHERAHVQLRHKSKQAHLESIIIIHIIIALGSALVIGILPSVIFAFFLFIVGSFALAYNARKQEYEADEIAFSYYGMVYVSALRKLPLPKPISPAWLTDLLRVHPSMQKRILRLVDTI